MARGREQPAPRVPSRVQSSASVMGNINCSFSAFEPLSSFTSWSTRLTPPESDEFRVKCLHLVPSWKYPLTWRRDLGSGLCAGTRSGPYLRPWQGSVSICSVDGTLWKKSDDRAASLSAPGKKLRLLMMWGLPWWLTSAGNSGDQGTIPGLGRSSEEGNGHSLHYSCLENLMDRGTWWATVHEVTNCWTRLSD